MTEREEERDKTWDMKRHRKQNGQLCWTESRGLQRCHEIEILLKSGSDVEDQQKRKNSFLLNLRSSHSEKHKKMISVWVALNILSKSSLS